LSGVKSSLVGIRLYPIEFTEGIEKIVNCVTIPELDEKIYEYQS
jgi:hypothetical protein